MKSLGLAAIVAMALTAVLGAQGALASQLNSESFPVTIGSSNPYGNQTWNFAAGVQNCDAPQLEATVGGSGSAKIDAGAKDASCYSQYIGNQLKMNGCSFTYRFGAKTETGSFNGTVDIVCPEGKTVSLSGGGLACQITVPAQKGIPATYQNVGVGIERAIKATVETAALRYSQVSGYNCGGSIGSFSNGTWSGSWKIQGSNGFGSDGIWLTGEGFELPPAGIAINGTPPKLVAGTYPISIAGGQKEGAQHTLNLAAGAFKCTTAKLNTGASGAAAQFTVTPEYAGCTTAGVASTINMNGCTYTFNVLNQAPVGSTYAGHADIACPAGKAIEIVVKPTGGKTICTVTIGAQTTDNGGLSFTNEAATSTLGLGLSIAGIDYKQVKGEGLAACTTQEKTNGTYTGSSTLVGSY